jgi:hypothetical protein
MANRFRSTLFRLILAALLVLPAGIAASQNGVDCSAAARRVVSQTGGQLLSAKATKQGNRAMCQITVLTSDASGKRRSKKTVMTSP